MFNRFTFVVSRGGSGPDFLCSSGLQGRSEAAGNPWVNVVFLSIRAPVMFAEATTLATALVLMQSWVSVSFSVRPHCGSGPDFLSSSGLQGRSEAAGNLGVNVVFVSIRAPVMFAEAQTLATALVLMQSWVSVSFSGRPSVRPGWSGVLPPWFPGRSRCR